MAADEYRLEAKEKSLPNPSKEIFSLRYSICIICGHLCSSVVCIHFLAVTASDGALSAGLAACTRRISFWAALFMRTSKFAIQPLNKTCVKTSGIAVIRPIAVANNARPMAPACDATPSDPAAWALPISLNVLIMLTTVPSSPTMVGLLGTVVSMINTFSEIGKAQAAGSEGVASQAGAIGLALFATAMGLITAIPLVFTHVLFKGWIANFEVRMKSAAQKLILRVQAAKPADKAPSEAVTARK